MQTALSNLLLYPLYSTFSSCSPESKPVLEDKLYEVATYLLSSYDNGAVTLALEEGPDSWKKWVKSFGKSLKHKGKSLFMPLRLLLTGKVHGPDMASSILLPHKAGKYGLDERFKMLSEVDWESFNKDQPPLESAVVASH